MLVVIFAFFVIYHYELVVLASRVTEVLNEESAEIPPCDYIMTSTFHDVLPIRGYTIHIAIAPENVLHFLAHE